MVKLPNFLRHQLNNLNSSRAHEAGTDVEPQVPHNAELTDRSTEHPHAGMTPRDDDGIHGILEGLNRGDGKTHDIPETFGEHGTHTPKNPAVKKMTIPQQILSKFPFTKERGARKEGKHQVYKEQTTIKTTAEVIAEELAARDAQRRAEKLSAAGGEAQYA